MTVRNLVLAGAAAYLLSGHVTAQAPPAPDTDQRCKALEDKMDRVLKTLEGRTPALPKPEELDRQLELLTKARDHVLVQFEQAQREYQDFRLKSPFAFGRSTPDIAGKRIAREVDTAQDLRRRLDEAESRMVLVKKVGDSAEECRGLVILLQRRGVDVDVLKRTAGGENAGAQDMVRVYGTSLRLEAEELHRLLDATQRRIDEAQKAAREMNAYEVTEDRLRTTKEMSQKLLDALVGQLQRMDATREMMRQPKP
jgi:hypothetical protein